MSKIYKTLEERFWERVTKGSDTECWLWKRNGKRYGYCWSKNKNVMVHRISWEIANKQPVPEGLCVLHHCDNTLCVNPLHLWLGTQLDNIRDRETKGRGNYSGITLDQRGEKNRRAKLKNSDIPEIRRLLKAGHTQREIAKLFNICQATIYLIKHGKQWSSV
jgi:hypothetical protein